jgi:acyl carrier protein
MITVEQLCSEIASALEVADDAVNLDTQSVDLEEWDSLGHITILTRLDDLLDNISERLPALAEATSVRETWDLIKSEF